MPLKVTNLTVDTEGEFDDDLDHLAKHLAWEAGLLNKVLEHYDHGEPLPEYLAARFTTMPRRLLLLTVALGEELGVPMWGEEADDGD